MNVGLATPIVKSAVEHKLPLKYGETATVVTTYTDCDAAKILFDYVIYNSEGRVAASGSTVQVFLNMDGNMLLYPPEFILQWKNKVGLLP
jgi:acyl-CoA thioester hydrolase